MKFTSKTRVIQGTAVIVTKMTTKSGDVMYGVRTYDGTDLTPCNYLPENPSTTKIRDLLKAA